MCEQSGDVNRRGVFDAPSIREGLIAVQTKEAITVAKMWVHDVFSEEGIMNLGLEEIRKDDRTGDWLITIGFSRPWNSNRSVLAAIGPDGSMKRSYKVVRVDDDSGSVLSVVDRENIS